jgi:hypothetical protein
MELSQHLQSVDDLRDDLQALGAGVGDSTGTGAGRGAPRRADALQSGEQGGKGILAPWLVAPPAGLGA